MQKRTFLTVGEAMVVLAADELNVDLADAQHYTKYLAGAELNVAIGIARLGMPAAYLTRIGQDPFGKFIREQLTNAGIQTPDLQVDADHRTGFYLKQLVDHGDPATYYFRKNSAAANFDSNGLAVLDWTNVGLVHTTGIMAAVSPQGLASVQQLLKIATQRQIVTTFDPNLRPALWRDTNEMRETLNKLASHAQIILPGVHEGEVLTGSTDPQKIADFYLQQSDLTQAVVVKLGAKGAYVQSKDGLKQLVSGYHVDQVVDTVGAGDGFAVGITSGILAGKSLIEATDRACAIGALAVGSASDSGGYPTSNQLKEYMEQAHAKN